MESERNAVEHTEIRAEIRGVLAQLDANYDLLFEKLDRILEQTTKTNGRVTALENDIDFIRILKKYKWLFGLVILGIYIAVNYMNIEKLLKLVL